MDPPERVQPSPGRSTLTQQLIPQEDERADEPLFADAQWETLEREADGNTSDSDGLDLAAFERAGNAGAEGQRDDQEEEDDSARRHAQGAGDQDAEDADAEEKGMEHPDGVAALHSLGIKPLASSPTDDRAESNVDTEHADSDQDDRPRAGPPTARAAREGWEAPQGRFNSSAVQSRDRITGPHQLLRPGLHFHENRKEVDTLPPTVFPARRYIIGSRGQLIQHIDDLKPSDRVAFNPVPPRWLRSEGVHSFHALTFLERKGSAWMSLSRFKEKGKRSEKGMTREIRRQTAHTMPGVPDGFKQRRVLRYFLKGHERARDHIAPHHEERWILPNKTDEANKLEHYLYRPGTKLYNICLNLPSAGTPPVASDSARPGDPFFISKVRQTVATFAAGTDERVRKYDIKFIFGAPAKKNEKDELVPVIQRRGWVVANVLGTKP